MQLTLTLELTAENLEKLKAFCEETGAAPAPVAPAKKVAAKPAGAKAQKEPEAEQAAEPEKTAELEKAAETEAKTYSITDVRAVALKLSKAGKSDTLKEIFAKFGATKLSEVPAENYPELMEELANA